MTSLLSGYNPSDGVLTGMTTAQKQAALAAAQQAYVELMSGSKVVTASYSQGDSSQTVSFKATDVANLTAFIRMLQASLGLITTPRRPVRFNFR